MNIVHLLIASIKSRGVRATLEAGVRRLFEKPLEESRPYIGHFADKIGIEIGGPSSIFRKQIPIYKKAKAIDNVDISRNPTHKNGPEASERFYYCPRKNGIQYSYDAVRLDDFESSSYDFLISSNTLEHIANPLKALREWIRIIKPGGFILLVLPNKDYNFDHKREITTLEHIEKDYENNVAESDLTHLDEILALHDLAMDLPAGSKEEFAERSRDNMKKRCLHHHVFDLSLLGELLKSLNLKVIGMHSAKHDLVIIGKK